METSTLISPAQQETDNEHLKLLAVFHFVICGLTLCGTGFLGLHFLIMRTVFSNPQMFQGPNGQFGPPPEFLAAFKWFYLFMAFVMVNAFVGNLLSGLFLLKKRHRMFSMVIAGLDCLQVPFGTALGVFTFIVLLRNSVRDSYLRHN